MRWLEVIMQRLFSILVALCAISFVGAQSGSQKLEQASELSRPDIVLAALSASGWKIDVSVSVAPIDSSEMPDGNSVSGLFTVSAQGYNPLTKSLLTYVEQDYSLSVATVKILIDISAQPLRPAIACQIRR